MPFVVMFEHDARMMASTSATFTAALIDGRQVGARHFPASSTLESYAACKSADDEAYRRAARLGGSSALYFTISPAFLVATHASPLMDTNMGDAMLRAASWPDAAISHDS